MIEIILNELQFNFDSLDEYDHLSNFFYNAHKSMRKKKSDNKQKLPGYEPKFSNSSFAVFDDFNTKNVETF